MSDVTEQERQRLRCLISELSLDRDDNAGKGITTDKAISIGFCISKAFQMSDRRGRNIVFSHSEENIFSKERYYFEKEYDRFLLDLV